MLDAADDPGLHVPLTIWHRKRAQIRLPRDAVLTNSRCRSIAQIRYKGGVRVHPPLTKIAAYFVALCAWVLSVVLWLMMALK
jgi:hypothetical protein